MVEVVAETPSGIVSGFGGDCFPPLWFDKDATKSFELQVEEMVFAIGTAAACFRDAFRTGRTVFDGWCDAHAETMRAVTERSLPRLLAAFGGGMLERALLDATARAANVSFSKGLAADCFGIRPGRIHPELAGARLSDWIPAEPARHVWVRQTVGFADPLGREELVEGVWPDDGFPVAIEDYLADSRVRYFKLKVGNHLERDVARLRAFAALAERYWGDAYRLTLDGNEQYARMADFESLVDAIESDANLATLWSNTLVIEQPLSRAAAMSADETRGIRELSARKPIIIDESDSDVHSFREAIDVGYRGVSSKNCKGPIKSLLNAGLARRFTLRDPGRPMIVTGEDLCSVGVIPVQADLCLAATLGLEHVERNGHHYHKGLDYLPPGERRLALARHGDFYAERAGRIAPRIRDGRFAIASLQCVGFGFDFAPDMGARDPIELA